MRGKPLDLSGGSKECPKCGETKLLSEFHKSKNTVHGFQVYCKSCNAVRYDIWRRQNLPKMAEDQKRRRRADPDRWHEYGLKKSYRLERGEFAKMLAAQNGCCAICGTDKPKGKGRFHVDHCHDTKIVRGLLCQHCNFGIGQFFHRIKLLNAAISYLAKCGIKS